MADFEVRLTYQGTEHASYEFLALNAAAQEYIEESLQLQNTGTNVRRMHVNGTGNMLDEVEAIRAEGLEVAFPQSTLRAAVEV